MNTLVKLMLVFMLMLVATPAFSAEAIHMWQCEMDDDATEEEVVASAKAWVSAAKKIEGGAQIKAYVYFPVAVTNTGESDLTFVVIAPSFAEWGKFWDNYSGSAAAEVERQNLEKVVCPDSAVWESIKIQ
ncbi:MAG: hypothetical protein JRK53_02375 [Deltaproteobacteria bacterium]|nr:hypothetical protein [Deltaproteobacteria bacterium]